MEEPRINLVRSILPRLPAHQGGGGGGATTVVVVAVVIVVTLPLLPTQEGLLLLGGNLSPNTTEILPLDQVSLFLSPG